jgi:hypothetical protein
MPVKRGRKEVAQAIAAVSGLVQVTLVGNSFTTNPSDLFNRTFNDEKVGIDDDRMPDFKEALKVLLKGQGITSTINQIPENSNILIEKAAEVIWLAFILRAAQNDMQE